MATNKQTAEWMQRQNEWIKEIDPRLRISKSDCRAGNKFAIVQDTPWGSCNLVTEFMTKQEWFIFRYTINICGEDAFREGIKSRIME